MLRRSGLPAAVLLFSFAGCGDDAELPRQSSETTSSSTAGGAGGTGGSGAAGGGGGETGPCRVLSPSETALDFYSTALFGITARVDEPLDGYATSRLVLELYPGADAYPMPGTYDLSAAPDDTYETCQHCVLFLGFDDAAQARRAFFQESGTMTITKFDTDNFGIAAGEIADVRLVEVTQNDDGSWNLVQGGLCFDVPSWSFDTTIVDGGPCDTGEDCPNEGAQVCDVETHTCQSFQCSLFGDPPFCDAGARCMSQYGTLIDREEAGPAGGACYAGCSPSGAGAQGDCSEGATCFALDATQTMGVCLATGGPAVGEACTLSDVGTGCGPGGICTGEPPTCTAICDYLTADAGCPSGTYCSSLNLCEPLDVGDIAPVGQLCAPGTPTLTDCGPEGDAFRGLCFRIFESQEDATCERVCRMDAPDCPAGLSCVGVFTNAEVGLCVDPGACGDGNLDLLGGETCDDGNTQSGDGCSGDCTTAELEPLCALATPLGVQDVVVDSNAGGVTGYTSLCDPFNATPTKTYSFMPPAPGELTLRLTSVPSLGLSVLADCLDASSEIDCRMDPGTDVLHINFPTVPAEPALVVVRGETPLETGLFVLESEFVVATCGDQLVVGPEACDDGNVTSGDGCAGDCSSIEWTNVCASLPPIEDGDVVDGDLDAGSKFFDLSAVCSYDSGRERAYTFVAPSDGTLQLEVSGEDDLSVYVSGDCGPIDPASFLACGNSAWEGQTESASAFLSAGQRVTVIVDGFTRDDAGPFTMNVSFSP